MTHIARLTGVAVTLLVSLLFAAPASAQATRTWISGVGDDVNPCSRTAPCKTFAGAISKTAAGGEIDCLDPGGFGAVTVTKSITLDCGGGVGGQVGSILVSGTNGINIFGASTDQIKVRNLTINGVQKTGSPGLSGIKFNTGAALIVEHVGIFGMGGTQDFNGGIDFEPQAAAILYTTDVEIQNGIADGILIKPTSTGSAKASIVRTTAINNSGFGLRVDNVNTTGGLGSNVSVWESNFSGNTDGIVAAAVSPNGPAVVTITNSVIAQNSAAGVLANGSAATATVGFNQISGNNKSVNFLNSGTLATFGDNYLGGNATAGATNGTGSKI